MARAEFSSLDTRVALQTYTVLAVLGGIIIVNWGHDWFGGAHLAELEWGRVALVRMAGAFVMAMGFCAAGIAHADVLARRRGLSWFIGAHAVIFLILVTQIRGPWGDTPPASQAAWALLAIILGLLYLRMPAEPARRPPISIVEPAPHSNATDPVRSRYEQQIRDAAAQEERNRLARDLHDAIKQQIFAIRTSAATAEARFDADPAGAREAVAQVRQSAREAMAEMEAMLDHLRVVPLENAGLVEAIKKQAEALAFRTGARVDVRVGTLPANESLEPGTHQAIFRVVQEALANVGRHARARQASVSLDAWAGRFDVRIEDDGAGVHIDREGGGMGMQNMRARAAELNGSLDIQPRPSGGTMVTLSVPYETPDGVAARRRLALGFTIAYGVVSASALIGVLQNGFRPASVPLLFFALAFVHHLLMYWRLRRAANPAVPGGRAA